MALALLWSPRALTDIEDIAEYIHRDSPLYAASTIAKIFNSAQPTFDKFSAYLRKKGEF
jgi:plasmid stabilization system protein ParE